MRQEVFSEHNDVATASVRCVFVVRFGTSGVVKKRRMRCVLSQIFRVGNSPNGLRRRKAVGSPSKSTKAD